MRHSCPAPDQLRQLLTEQLDAAQRDRLDAHVESCPACQETLARISDDLSPPPEAVGARPGPEALPEAAREVVSYLVRHPPRPAGPPLASLRYRPVRLHATGGLGEVHVAEDEELPRRVALKRLQERYARHPASRARFLREAALTSRLEHPGVVPVHGLMQDADGQPCYAMRFVEGESLREAIERFHATGAAAGDKPEASAREGPRPRFGLEFRQLLGRFVAVCHTVAYAHSRGVVHRDLKPANIMLGAYGETLVVDWGLAKPLDQAEAGQGTEACPSDAEGWPVGETQLGQAMGTPAYMSPEQAAGRWDQVGPASDIYSLGATLYCLLTGRPPYEGPDVEVVLARVRRGELVRPRQVQPAVPRALEAVCLKAMAPKPEERYPSASALAGEVERWLADEPVAAYLVVLLQAQGQPADALALYRQNLDAYRRTLGPVHADTLGAVNNLAHALQGRGELAEAERLYQENLEACRRTLGPDHPSTLTAVNNLAGVLLARRKPAEAEVLYRQNLEARRRVLGPEHPETLTAVNNLAGALQNQGNRDKLAEAERLYRQNLEDLRRILGLDKPRTLMAANSLARVLHAQGNLAAAEAILRQNLEAGRGVAGPDQATMLATLNHLAVLLQAQGKLTEAELFLRDAVELARKVLPKNHPDRATILARLGLLLMATGKAQEAEPFLREYLEICGQVFPPGHPQTANAESQLGGCLTALGRYAEAEPRLLKSYEVLRTARGVTPRDRSQALDRLIQLYDAWGKPEQAATWRSQRDQPAPPAAKSSTK